MSNKIPPYRLTRIFSSDFDDHIVINTDHIKDVEGLVCEIENRVSSGSKKIPRSWFYKACKRNEIGTHLALIHLRMKGVIDPGHVDFPLNVNISKPIYKSYDEWRFQLQQVTRGVTSHASRYSFETGKTTALFNQHQVHPVEMLTPSMMNAESIRLKELNNEQ